MILVGGLDVAELTFYVFFLFFLGLVIHLNRESRREGYPLEDEVTGRLVADAGPLADGPPKFFRLPFGKGVQATPTGGRDPFPVNVRKVDRSPGSALDPTGNPLIDGIGPAAVARRAQYPDLTAEGHDRVIPIRDATQYFIAREDPDPRGFIVLGSDKEVAGTVSDIWVDQSDRLIRYLEVATTEGPRVLAPMTMLSVKRRARQIHCDSLSGRQFAGAPVIAGDSITRDEEERVVGYFGGGYLYSRPSRSEPIL